MVCIYYLFLCITCYVILNTHKRQTYKLQLTIYHNILAWCEYHSLVVLNRLSSELCQMTHMTSLPSEELNRRTAWCLNP